MPFDPLEFLLERPWRGEHLPALPRVPTMLSGKERQLLYVLARDYAEDDAAVVGGGCFLGGSTTALPAGVRDRTKRWRDESLRWVAPAPTEAA